MLDQYFTDMVAPFGVGASVSIFTPATNGVSSVAAPRMNSNFGNWTKPRGHTMLFAIIVASGASGSNGASGLAGTSRNGGVGGTSGAWASVLVPLIFLPETLYVRCGYGGGRGPAGQPFNQTGIHCMGEDDNQGYATPLLGSLLTGASPSAVVGGMMPNAGISVYQVSDVSLPSNGGTGPAKGGDLFPLSVSRVCGGTGGGGCGIDNASWPGGNMFTNGPLGPVSGGLVTGGAGLHGTSLMPYFMGLGGTGGASNGTGTGGRGGNGATGCGGGGGGGGVTGGTGGLGGDGFAILITW